MHNSLQFGCFEAIASQWHLNSYAQHSENTVSYIPPGMQGLLTTEYSYELRKERCATCS